MFKIAESVDALYVRKIPIGSRMIAETHIPWKGVTILSRAIFSPDRDMI